MKVLCVLNPSAAEGMALRLWPEVEALLKSFQLDYYLLAGNEQPLSCQVFDHLTAQPPATYDAIAGIGGDGTHSAILNGLMAVRQIQSHFALPPYAFIPLGTGNDIAKSLGIRTRDDRFKSDLRRAIAAIIHGADYRLDLGIVNGIYFADAFTVGLDSMILRERNTHKERLSRIPILRDILRGRLLYTLSSGKPLLRQAPLKGEIQVDGRVWYSGLFLNLVINNTRIYAGEFDFSENAFSNDGLLDIVLFVGHQDYLARYLMAMRSNPKKVRQWSEKLNRMSSHVQGQKIRIQLETPVPVQCDGEEVAPCDIFEISVVPRAIAIKTPAEPV